MWLKVLIFIGILGVVATGASLFVHEKANDVVEAQIEAIRNDKLTEAYYGFTSLEFQQETSLDKFKDFVKPLHPILLTSQAFEDYPIAQHTYVVRTTFDNHRQPITLDYSLLKQEGKWKIFNIKLAGASDQRSDPAINQPDSPIKALFTLLQHQAIDQAFETTTASSFQKTIPKDAFIDFVNNLSILRDYDRLEIALISQDVNLATSKVLLYKDNLIFHMQFLTMIEDYQWKIRSIEVLSGDGKVVKGPQKEDLVKSIKEFLKAIQQADYSTAYERYTSEEFKKTSPQDELVTFFKKHPFIATNQKSQFYKIAFDHNIATITSQFLTENQETRYVQFLLIQDHQFWKIFHIHILDDKAEKTAELGV